MPGVCVNGIGNETLADTGPCSPGKLIRPHCSIEPSGIFRQPEPDAYDDISGI